MKNKKILTISVFALVLALVSGFIVYTFLFQNNKTEKIALPEEVKISLNEAIMDEYKAQTFYKKTIEKFGVVKPFSNIIQAEEKHISSLKSLFEKYGLSIPENNLENIVALDTVKDSCAAGVSAEIENAKLFREKLLPTVENYEDIRLVFQNLMRASEENHLPAFERCD